MRRALVALLLIAPTLAWAAHRDTMTLVEARALSPQALATRLLGAVGANGDFVEADVHGNGSGMIGQPGLNSVDLYRRPVSAGFPGLCQVDGVTVEFSSSRYNTPGDPPHVVRDFWKFSRFALLSSGMLRDRSAFAPRGAACARLGPVANRTDPVFFAVDSDQPVRAYFAMRALDLAQRDAADLPIACKSDPTLRPICRDKVAGLKAVPIGQIERTSVSPCAVDGGTCVKATWMEAQHDNVYQEITLTVETDATVLDPPPTSFRIRSVAVDQGTLIAD